MAEEPERQLEKQDETERVKQLISSLDGLPVDILNNISALVEIGESAVEPLLEALEDLRLRWGAIVALGDIGDARAVEHIIPLLNDIVPLIKGAAAIALGKIGDSRAVDPLIQVLKNEKGVVIRQFAVQALGEIKDKRAVKPLINVLKDKEFSRTDFSRKAVKKALDNIKHK